VAHKANVTTSKSYNTQSDFRFDTKTFTELKNAQTITLAYDGFNPLPPMLMYLKPCFLDADKSYFRQLEEGELGGSWLRNDSAVPSADRTLHSRSRGERDHG